MHKTAKFGMFLKRDATHSTDYHHHLLRQEAAHKS